MENGNQGIIKIVIQDSIWWIKNQVMGSIHGWMESLFIKGIFKMMYVMGMVNYKRMAKKNTRANGQMGK